MITVEFNLTKPESHIVYDAIRLNVIYSDVIDDTEYRVLFEKSMFALYKPLQHVMYGDAHSIQLNDYTARHILYSIQNLLYAGNTLHYIIDEEKFDEIRKCIKDLVYRLSKMIYIDNIFEEG